MSRVTGIGGTFIKSRDPHALRDWYRRHLGLDLQPWGGVTFRWPDDPTAARGATVWSVFADSSDYFAPSRSPFMVNYRVTDLPAVLAALRAEGCQVIDKTEESAYGRFGWVMDPEGNKIELWEPPAGDVPV